MKSFGNRTVSSGVLQNAPALGVMKQINGFSLFRPTAPTIILDPSAGALSDGAAQFTETSKEHLYIEDNATISATTVLEVGCWAYLDSTNTVRPLIVKGTSLSVAANLEYALFYSAASSNFKFVVSNGTDLTTVTDTGTAPTTGTWYFLRAGRKADGTLFIQRNGGTEITQAGAVEIQDSNKNLNLGYVAFPYYHNGRLDSVYLTKTISSTAEATALYNNGSGRRYDQLTSTNGLATFQSNLISFWGMNEEGIRRDMKGTNHLTPAGVQIINASTLNGGFESVASSPELLSNTGFETAGAGGADVFANWAEFAGGGTITDETTIVHSGSHAVKLSFVSGDLPYVGQTVSATANKTYKLTFWTRGDGTNAGLYAIYDGGGTAIISATTTGVTGTDYTQKTVYFSNPTGSTAVTVFLFGNATAGDAYFDDVSLTLVDFDNWVESSAGASTVIADTSEPYAGTYCCKLTIDSSSNNVNIRQSILTTGHRYKYTIYAKCAATSASIWVGQSSNTHSLTTSYVQYTGYFVAGSTSFFISSTSATGKTIFIDNVTLESLGPVPTQGIASGQASDGQYCGQFGGSNSLSIADASQTGLDAGTGDFSYEAWVNPDDVSSVAARILFKGAEADASPGYNLSLSTSSNIYAIFTDGTGTRTAAGYGSAIVPGLWYHCVVTHDRDGNMSLYVNNGTPVNASIATKTGDASNATAFSIGGISGGYYKGRADNVRFWSRVLTAEEVSTLFNSGLGLKYSGLTAGLKTGLVSSYEMGKYAGLTADSHGSNTLTNNSTVTFGRGVNFTEGAIATLTDQSGNSYNFTQTDPTKRPGYEPNFIGTQPVALFDGVDDAMSNANRLVGIGDITVVAVVKPLSFGTSNGGCIIHSGNFIFRVSSTNSRFAVSSNDTVSWAYAANNSVSAGTSYVAIVTRTSAGTTNIYINGALSGTADQSSGTPSTGSATTYIGNQSTGDRAFDGGIAEPIIYSGIKTPGEISAITRFLGNKYGITVA